MCEWQRHFAKEGVTSAIGIEEFLKNGPEASSRKVGCTSPIRQEKSFLGVQEAVFESLTSDRFEKADGFSGQRCCPIRNLGQVDRPHREREVGLAGAVRAIFI